MSFDNLSLTIGGVFTAKEQLFRSFGFSVEGFVMKEDASTLAEFSEFELFVDFGGEEVDLKSLQDNFEDITKIEEFTSTFSLKDYYLGKDVVKDLNLVIAGINSLTGDFISYEVDKDSDDIELDLDINEKSLGTVSFDSSLDISNIEDPKLDLELKLSDLKREYFDMLSQIVQMKNIGALKGDDGFEFEFKGAISELEGMFN